MKRLTISSTLPRAYREELEHLLFFNPNQGRVSRGILCSIQRYGTPRIICQGDRLRVVVGNYPDLQALYAFEESPTPPRLVGSVIYLRDRLTNLTILHIAVAPDYVMARRHADIPLAVQLFTKVMDVARQVKGIKTVTVIYGKGRRLRVPTRAVHSSPIPVPTAGHVAKRQQSA